MNKLEEITVYPKDISNQQHRSFNIPKIHPLVYIIFVIIIIYFIIKNRFSPEDDDFNGELKEIKNYVNNCKKGISYDKNSYTNIDWQPQISIIIPVANASKLIDIAYKSILNQSFKKVEIIFINDFPSNYMDNDIINALQNNDKRIILIKNKQNRGTFYSRNRGALLAKGKYIQFLDVDDLLVNNILEKTFNLSEKDNLDIVQFPYISVYRSGKKKIRYLGTTKGIVYQPQLKDIMFYEDGVLLDRLQKYMIWDKLIKKEVFIIALRFIGKENIIDRFAFADETLTTFALTNVAKSYTYLNEPGYYFYVSRNGSISASKYLDEKINLFARSTFKILKVFYDKADNDAKSKKKALCFYKTFYYNYWSKIPRLIVDNETIDTMNAAVDSIVENYFFDKDIRNNVIYLRNDVFGKIEQILDSIDVQENPNIFDNMSYDEN